MRLRDITREAGRNIATGSTRAVTLALVATAAACLLAEADLGAAGRLLSRTDQYVSAGASTYVIDAADAIDGAACDRLTSTGLIAASGALRRGEPRTLTPLPSTPVPVFEASPGWWALLDLPRAASIAVSDATAATIAPTLDAGHPTTIDGLTLDARFPWPDDGRRPEIGYGLVVRTAATTFDQCWARATDPTRDVSGLLFSVASTPPGGDDPQRSQLNPRLGTLTSLDEFADRPTRYAAAVAALVGVLIAYGAVRGRAVEHAHAAALGMRLTDHALLASIETLSWIAAALALAAGYVGERSVGAAPQHPLALLPLGLAPPLALAGAALLTTPLWISVIRLRSLDHYLRARGG